MGKHSARKSTQDVTFPPDTFNLSEHPFRPSTSFEPVQGLQEIVQDLCHRGRLRSAMDEIFKVLDVRPHNQLALRLAIIVVGSSRTQHLQAQEPIPLSYLNDRRLDPIYAVCSHCKNTSWVPTNCLFADAHLSILNPAGLQCRNCGYVVCRNCLDALNKDSRFTGGFRFGSTCCPNCKKDALSAPVYPTGRPSRQMKRHRQPILQVFVFREGPVPPDEEYMRQLLGTCSPDAIEDQAELVGIPMFPWPGDIEGLALAMLVKMQAEQRLHGRLEEGEYAHANDEEGNRAYIVKLMMHSPESIPEPHDHQERDWEVPRNAMNRKPADPIQCVAGSLKRLFKRRQVRRKERKMSPVEKMVSDLIRRHIERMAQQFKGRPGFAMTQSLLHGLLDHDILTFTQKVATEELRKSLLHNQHYWQSRQFGDLFLLVSAVPALDIASARTYFQGQYLAFVETQARLEGIQLGQVSVAHWVFCSDGDRMAVHLTFLPGSLGGMALLAQDMMTEAEKAELGMQ